MRLLVSAIAVALAPASGDSRDAAGSGAGRHPDTVEIGREPESRAGAGRRPGYLLQLDRGEVAEETGGRMIPLAPVAGAPPSLTLEQWSEGPLIAGYGTTYHVLIVGERICGEVLSSPWMTSFTEPLVRSLELLQAALPALAPQPTRRLRRLGLRAYAADGFPLMAGDGDPRLQGALLRFDHYPAETAIGPPEGPEP